MHQSLELPRMYKSINIVILNWRDTTRKLTDSKYCETAQLLVVTDCFFLMYLCSKQALGYRVAFAIKFFIPQIIKTISQHVHLKKLLLFFEAYSLTEVKQYSFINSVFLNPH